MSYLPADLPANFYCPKSSWRFFGCNFTARISTVQGPPGNLPAGLNPGFNGSLEEDIIEALKPTSLLYECDVCTRCGLTINARDKL